MEKIKFLYKFPRDGSNNSRYIVEIDGKERISVLVFKNFGIGAEIQIDNDKQWIEKYEKYKNNISDDDILTHLIQYKETKEQLKDCECGFWRDDEYDHILPEENKKLNLLDNGYKNELSNQYDELKGKIHDGFSHLNSSQAFALNFFVPIIQERLFDKFLGKIQTKEFGDNFKPEFEYIKDKKEGTQIDLYLETLAKSQNFAFEVKYSEDGFGRAKNDARHTKKYNEIYAPMLEKVLQNFDKETFRKQFFGKYQLWRNICFADENTNVCFVFPKFRKDLQEAVDEVKKLCQPKIQEKIHCIFVDDFVEKMMNGENAKLKNHYTEFYKKYLDIKK